MKTILRIRNFFSAHMPHLGSPRRRHSVREVRSPMDCIPNEILSVIFHLIFLDPDENPASSSSVSQVCSRWRDLAISTPKLWTRIAFTFPTTEAQHMYAGLCLGRSDPQPLSILVDCRDPEWDWEEENHQFGWSAMQSILEQLLPHAGRWETLDILTDTWLPIYSFLRITSSNNISRLPHLHSISLSRCNAYFAATGQIFQPLAFAEPIALFGGAAIPRLREVCLVGVHVDWDSSPLQNLTTLEFKYHAQNVLPTLVQFITILDNCPRLEQLTILGWGPRLDASPQADVTAIVLPSLHKLSFGFVDIAYGTQLLSILQVPSLKELSLEDIRSIVTPYPMDIHDSTQLLHWLYTSQPAARASFASTTSDAALPINPIPLQAVQSLELHNIHSNEDTFASFFRCFPNITSLTCMEVADEALLALSLFTIDDPRRLQNDRTGSRVDCHCPALQTLHCQDATPQVLVDLVAERAVVGSVPPLQSVTLEYARNPKPTYDSEEYARLERTGIRVVGSTPSGSEASDSE